MNRLFEMLTLAAAVGLLIFTAVYGTKLFAVETQPPYQLSFTEADCQGLGQALAETYAAASQKIPLPEVHEHVANFHFGPGVKPADKEYVLQTVDRVYAEYPETTTGQRVILECFAHAETQSKGVEI